MPCAVNATSAVPPTASTATYYSNSPDAILEQLSASIAEINQPISAIVMNAEAALRLLGAQPTDTEAVVQLLACIIKDGIRTGDIVSRTRALIKKAPPGTDASPTDADSD
jgi:C4-dicarboxylate-specific signal transduction histidine kinase